MIFDEKFMISGRVVLQIGDILFNVDQGSECQFAQDIAVVCPREKEVPARAAPKLHRWRFR